ncbi:retrovirus-related pol polyprotein from transposon TNT 1-94 [Tanacetum coccineum]
MHKSSCPVLLKIKTEPINEYFKNNRVVHRNYLRVIKEHVATLQELLDQDRALKPLDEQIGYASKFVEQIQELLVYVSASCPFTQSGNEKWAPATSHKKKNKPYVDASRTKQTIETVRKKSTNKASNCNAIWLKNVALSKNSDTICLSCNECLFSANHDACVVQYLKKMKKCLKWIPTVNPVDVPCPKLSLRYDNAQELLFKCMINSDFYPFNLHDFGFEGIIQDEELPPLEVQLSRSHLDNGTEFLNHTLRNYTEEVGITHMTSTACTPQQNGVVERCNHTLVEAVRTMLIFSKSSLFLWAEAVATACYTQNCSHIHTRYNKTPYELLRDRKPELKYLYVFGALCYPINDFEDLGKLQPKADDVLSCRLDTAYEGTRIRRIRNSECAFSYEVQALIRRIFFPGYVILGRKKQSSNIIVQPPKSAPFSMSSPITL